MEGNKWYVAYEGRAVPNEEGEQELEKRAALRPPFGRLECTWETNDVPSRAT